MRTILTRAGTLLLALALSALAPAAHAQTGAASITGLVTDQSGAAAPGVAVIATNQATNVEYFGSSNEAGHYTITSLPVGTYVVKASLTSFKTAATKPIALEAKQIARLDFKMEVGALEDTVEVVEPVAGAADRDVDGRRGHLREHGAVAAAERPQPRPARSAAAWRRDGQPARLHEHRQHQLEPARIVNGHREQTNNYTVDGLDVNETIDNRISYQPTPDALAEISVETNNYSADTGNVAGAVISNVVKSGANQFRGNVFEFYRNSDMDANTWEGNRSSAPKQERTQHIYGATLGGPILKDKLFFFADYQGSRQDAPGFTTASVAPEAWRRGDLSSISHRDPRPAHGPAVPGQPDPALPHLPDGARDPERHGELPASEPHRERRHGKLRGRDAVLGPRAPGRPPARLERLGQRQAIRARLVRQVRGPAREEPVPADARRRATTSRSTTSASTGAACSGPR